MAHFALIDENNIVRQVAVVSDNKLEGLPQPVAQEIIDNRGFCIDVPGRWVQTSYNATFRKHFAGIGFTYSDALDAFIPPKPYASWLLDEATCTWQPPTAMPINSNNYVWDETTQTWLVE